jgi:hypothetical protein
MTRQRALKRYCRSACSRIGGDKMKLLTRTLLLPLVACPIVAFGEAVAQEPVFIAGLNAPRGLSIADGALLVAEQGGGRILLVSPDGTSEVLLEGIVAGRFNSPEGPTIAGVSAVAKVGDRYFYAIAGSLGTIAGTEAIYAFREGELPLLLADLGQYERDNNTGWDVDHAATPEINSNPFDLVGDGHTGVFVTDAAANAILHVGADGTIALFAQFPDRDNPRWFHPRLGREGSLGGPKMDQVPTGLTIGPDGALYVTTLTGFPFPQGSARIYRVADQNGDGDALDWRDVTLFAEGLTAATDLAFSSDGTLYVTEFSTDMLNRAPGRLVQIANGTVTEVMGGLVSPTSVAVTEDGGVVVTQEFPGIITVVSAGL